MVWLYEVSLSDEELQAFIYQYGLVPAYLFERPQSLLTHMFLHGSWLHIIGNMWFLWVFGDNVEDRLGRVKYLIFYILSGLGAAIIQTLVSLLFGGEKLPMVGASGAISGVLGAYLWMFPHARILALVPIFFFLTFMELPAVFFIGMWILIQVVNGLIPFAILYHKSLYPLGSLHICTIIRHMLIKNYGYNRPIGKGPSTIIFYCVKPLMVHINMVDTAKGVKEGMFLVKDDHTFHMIPASVLFWGHLKGLSKHKARACR